MLLLRTLKINNSLTSQVKGSNSHITLARMLFSDNVVELVCMLSFHPSQRFKTL